MGKERVALITGATSGIGLELAKRLFKKDYQVLAVGRSSSILSDLKQLGLSTYQLDLSQSEDIEKLRLLIQQKKPSLAIHAAGSTFYGNLADREWEEVKLENRLHTESTLAIAHAQSKLALENSSTKFTLLLLSSAVAYTPTPCMSIYSAGKSWILTLSRLLQIESPSNLKVLVSTPGPVHTGFHQKASFNKFREKPLLFTSCKAAVDLLEKQIDSFQLERPIGFLAYLGKYGSKLIPFKWIAKLLYIQVRKRISL